MSDRLITFVCCVESGRLEHETILMLESLRRNGGTLGGSRVLVVNARRGQPLSPETVTALSRLDAELVFDRSANVAPWFNYSNKVAAVSLAQRRATTPLVAWLDSDILIASEPSGFSLPEGVDFAGRCEFLPPTIHDGDPTHEPYWVRLCALAGTRLEDLPEIYMDYPGVAIRLSFNSGIFIWRRASSFADSYVRMFANLLRSRLAQYNGSFFTADQVIISPVLVAQRLSWKHLDLADHHMVFQHMITGPGASPNMTGSRVIHYSRSLSPPFRSGFLKRLEREQPSLYTLVSSRGEEKNTPRSVGALTTFFALKLWRNLRWRWYSARTRVVPRGTKT